ncbi:MAG: RIP metalloprotease RseP [Patescibacteria group bacterium]|jgi:regulator of sigma E protease
MLLTIIIFILVLSLLVFVHELGHFLTARGFGVKCEEFGMGLPPRVIGWQKYQGRWRLIWGNREIAPAEPMIYSINWIPVGGFVKIKGENGEQASEADSFGHKPIWQRNIILAAGVTMNLILCVLLLSLGFAIGMPSAVEDNQGGKFVAPPEVQVTEILPDMPAAQNDIKPGDIIAKVNGVEITSSQGLKDNFNQLVGQTARITIERDNAQLEKDIMIAQKDGIIGIGIGIMDVGVVRYPLPLALWQGLKMTWQWLVLIVLAVAGLIRQLFGGPSLGLDFAGPVGIAVMTGQAAKMGWIYVLQFVALLSLNLAIINILPFPALDGGRIMFLAVEKIRGKAVNSKWENLSHNVGFLLLMLLIVVITYRDIIRYGAKIISVFKRSVGL